MKRHIHSSRCDSHSKRSLLSAHSKLLLFSLMSKNSSKKEGRSISKKSALSTKRGSRVFWMDFELSRQKLSLQSENTSMIHMEMNMTMMKCDWQDSFYKLNLIAVFLLSLNPRYEKCKIRLICFSSGFLYTQFALFFTLNEYVL